MATSTELLEWIDTNIHSGLCECEWCSAYMLIMYVERQLNPKGATQNGNN